LTETRRNSRALCSDFVRIAWIDNRLHRHCSVGLLEDVSQGGMCVALEASVPLVPKVLMQVVPNVLVQAPGLSLMAAVRHCERGNYGYLVGLEFLGGHLWDKAKWRPKHLLEMPSGAQP
jgi:hypothetical protein